jgi:hypothetical protein
VSVQLDALLKLDIYLSRMVSLDCLGDLPLLEKLSLRSCNNLVSVPGSHGNYSALRQLSIQYCPAMNMKPLYQCLQQRLDSLEYKDLSYAGSSDPCEGTFRFRLLYLFSVFFLLVYCDTACSLMFYSALLVC